jgi:NADPH:quinone reductase-like Zn-dependent oxidoreductase
MKAIVQDVYGSADVLELRDINRPPIGDEEVLVQVRAAGVDPGCVAPDGRRALPYPRHGVWASHA